MATNPRPAFIPSTPALKTRWEKEAEDVMEVIDILTSKMTRDAKEQFLEELGYQIQLRLEAIDDGT